MWDLDDTTDVISSYVNNNINTFEGSSVDMENHSRENTGRSYLTAKTNKYSSYWDNTDNKDQGKYLVLFFIENTNTQEKLNYERNNKTYPR